MAAPAESQTGEVELSQEQMAQDELMSYKTGFRNLLWVVKLESLVIVILVCTIYYFVDYVLPQDRFFAVSAAGTRQQMVGLKEPNLNKNALVSWLGAATTEIMTFNFLNYDEVFGKSKRFFSKDGWESFSTALLKSGLLKSVTDYQQVITSIPREEPTVVAEGVIEGQYRWVMNVSLIMTTRAGSKKTTKGYGIMVILVKEDTIDNPMGVGIYQWSIM
ncbi:MAG: DotI/IcmL/TraM family protein [Alphaproteobacteria bacterium]